MPCCTFSFLHLESKVFFGHPQFSIIHVNIHLINFTLSINNTCTQIKKNNCQIRMILSRNSILGQSVCFSMKNGHSLNKYWNSFPNSNAYQSTCIKVNIQMLFFVFIIMRRYDNKPNTSNVLSFFSLHNYLVSFSFLEKCRGWIQMKHKGA